MGTGKRKPNSVSENSQPKKILLENENFLGRKEENGAINKNG